MSFEKIDSCAVAKIWTRPVSIGIYMSFEKIDLCVLCKIQPVRTQILISCSRVLERVIGASQLLDLARFRRYKARPPLR
jgi:hypothetical protein